MRCAFLNTCLAALLTLTSVGVARADVAPAAQELPGIHNFFAATTNILSGSQPEGDAGFASLAKLGVKTILSVDGAKPDVDLAAKHGLRYVHLPIGYDGIPTNRIAELAKAGATLPGPIYVHCHHGKHRGPAAVSVICLADAGWTPAQAVEFMRHAGTGAEYPGLYRAAQDFKPLSAQQLAAVSSAFLSVVNPSSLVETMVAADHIQEHLKRAQADGWQTPAQHSDIAPAHEALMLLEQFRELARMEDTARRAPDYRTQLETAVAATEALHAQLKQGGPADAAFKLVNQSCVDCHRRYRNE